MAHLMRKILPTRHVVFFFVVITTAADPATSCPGSCTCPSPEVVDCASAGLDHIPDDLPATAVTVDLSHNSIGDLTNGTFEGLPNLGSLDLTVNNITTVEYGTFSTLASLQVLKLSNNSILEVDEQTFVGLDNLAELALSFNPGLVVTKGALHVMSSLITLDMNGCGSKAGKYKFSDMRSLLQLKLSHCDLHQLDPANFQNMESLESLSLSNNVFHSFPSGAIEAMSNLKVLNLRMNSVDVNAGKLLAVPSLITHLHLDDNEITLVSSDTFHDMRQLQQLTLKDNKIRTLPETIFTGIPVTGESLQLELAGNPLNCDCNLRWLLQWAEDNDLDDAICNEPEENKYAVLKSLEPDQTACRPYEIAGQHIYRAFVGDEVTIGCPIFVDDYATVQWSHDCGGVVVIPSSFPPVYPYFINDNHALIIEDVTEKMCDTYICEVQTTVGAVSAELTLIVMTQSKDLSGVVIALSVGIGIFALLVIVALVMMGLRHRRQTTADRPATGPYSNLTESMAEITTE